MTARTITQEEALTVIAGKRCSRLTRGTCWDHGDRYVDALYGDDKACDECIARAALDRTPVHYQPPVELLADKLGMAARELRDAGHPLYSGWVMEAVAALRNVQERGVAVFPEP